MIYYGYEFIRESDLTHHGILGQKWGVRRFQNKDGTLTAAGKKRRGNNSEESKHMSDKTKANLKKAAKIGAVVVGTALVAYGGYKIAQNISDYKKASELGKAWLNRAREAEARTPDRSNFRKSMFEWTGEHDHRMGAGEYGPVAPNLWDAAVSNISLSETDSREVTRQLKKTIQKARSYNRENSFYNARNRVLDKVDPYHTFTADGTRHKRYQAKIIDVNRFIRDQSPNQISAKNAKRISEYLDREQLYNRRRFSHR